MKASSSPATLGIFAASVLTAAIPFVLSAQQGSSAAPTSGIGPDAATRAVSREPRPGARAWTRRTEAARRGRTDAARREAGASLRVSVKHVDAARRVDVPWRLDAGTRVVAAKQEVAARHADAAMDAAMDAARTRAAVEAPAAAAEH